MFVIKFVGKFQQYKIMNAYETNSRNSKFVLSIARTLVNESFSHCAHPEFHLRSDRRITVHTTIIHSPLRGPTTISLPSLIIIYTNILYIYTNYGVFYFGFK